MLETLAQVSRTAPPDAWRRDHRDDPWVREQVGASLRAAGYVVAEASNGLTGLRLAERDRPDVVLLDLALPEIAGCDVLQRLKADATTRDIPVIAVSDFAEPLFRSGRCHVDATLPKPVDGQAATRLVKRVTALAH